MTEEAKIRDEVMRHYDLAITMAAHYYHARRLHRWHSCEDVRQEALLAVVEAAGKCDVSRPAHEKTAFFRRRIAWHLSHMARSGGLVRISPGACQASARTARREHALNVNGRAFHSFDEADGLPQRGESSAEDVAAAHEAACLVQRLPERQRRVIARRYGLEDGHGQSLAEVGEALGVSKQCAHAYEQQALELLRGMMGLVV